MPHNKSSIFKRILLSFFAALGLSILFGISSLPFMQIADGLPYDERAKIGGQNVWRIVFVYGFFTTVFVLLSMFRRSYKYTSIFLIFFMIIGTSLVIYINNYETPIYGPNGQVLSKNDYCTRVEPYQIKPEFQRAISLMEQRFSNILVETSGKIPSKNCLNIQYGTAASMEGAEGYFLFDQNSSANDLRIFVSPEYKNYDDILTTILLSHEITHALQFLDEKIGISKMSCYDKEVDAFSRELSLINSLNDEERKSLVVRVNNDPNLNGAYTGIKNLFDINDNAVYSCRNIKFDPSPNSPSTKCYWDNVKTMLSEQIQQSEYYQKQCKDS